MLKVYGVPTCHKCMALKKELEEKGTQFEYLDADANISDISDSGIFSLPIIKDGERFLSLEEYENN